MGWKIVNGILNTVITVCIVAVLALFLCNAAGLCTYVVQSGSMEPAIGTGSLCFVNTHASFGQITEGDIIAFELPTGTLATHRVIDVMPDGLETQGDNTEQSDGISTTRENFVGETLFAIPKIGYVIHFLTTTRGMILGITGVLCLIILNHLLPSGEKEKAADK